MFPARSSAMKFTVPRSSPTVFATTGASVALRRTLAGVSCAFASRSTQSLRVDGVSSVAFSARISAAKRFAPSPTSMTCGSRSMTARATLIGWRYPTSAPMAPTRCVVPSTSDASSSTTPRTFGFPPRPTLVSVGSASITRAHASTASSALPPLRSTAMPAARPVAPFPLATTIGVIFAIYRLLLTRSGWSCRARGKRAQPRRSDFDIHFVGGMYRTSRFHLDGGEVSPAGPMARRARRSKVARMLNASPMAWTASVMAPRSPYPEGDVTVLLRVTYNTLEAIIRDEFMLTESHVAH